MMGLIWYSAVLVCVINLRLRYLLGKSLTLCIEIFLVLLNHLYHLTPWALTRESSRYVNRACVQCVQALARIAGA